jgi:hypothetical protein
VRENGTDRPIRPDEIWAVRKAEEELARIKALHRAKRDAKLRHAGEEVFAALETDSNL